MTVAEVLAAHGLPLGTYGRTRCPLHEGSNARAFSYADEVFHCFVCNQSGGSHQLERLLGGRPPSRWRPLGGLRLKPHAPPRPTPTLGALLEEARAEVAERRAQTNAEAHCAALRRQEKAARWGRLAARFSDWRREVCLAVAAGIWVEATDELDRLDADVACGCEGGRCT